MEGRGRDRQAEKEMETERHKQTHIDQLTKEWAEASEWSELQFKGRVEINQVQNLGRSHSMQRVKNVKGCKTWSSLADNLSGSFKSSAATEVPSGGK